MFRAGAMRLIPRYEHVQSGCNETDTRYEHVQSGCNETDTRYEPSWMKRQLREPSYTILSNSKIKNDYNFTFHIPECHMLMFKVQRNFFGYVLVLIRLLINNHVNHI